MNCGFAFEFLLPPLLLTYVWGLRGDAFDLRDRADGCSMPPV